MKARRAPPASSCAWSSSARQRRVVERGQDQALDQLRGQLAAAAVAHAGCGASRDRHRAVGEGQGGAFRGHRLLPRRRGADPTAGAAAPCASPGCGGSTRTARRRRSRTARACCPPSRPAKPMVSRPVLARAPSARMTLAEAPEVEMPSSDVGRPRQQLELIGEDAREVGVVADRGQERGVVGQRQRRQRAALLDDRVLELDGDVLRVAGRAAVADRTAGAPPPAKRSASACDAALRGASALAAKNALAASRALARLAQDRVSSSSAPARHAARVGGRTGSRRRTRPRPRPWSRRAASRGVHCRPNAGQSRRLLEPAQDRAR